MKKLIIAIVVVSGLVLAVGVTFGVLGGTDQQGDDQGPPAALASDATTPTEASTVPTGLESFYAQRLAWQVCGSDMCAALEVPLDYAEPDGKTIEIAVEMSPAAGARVGSLVVNPGGPGAAGTTVVDEASSYFAPALLASFDIVGFDPRGTGESSPLDCISDRELDEYVAADPTPDNRSEVRHFVDRRARFWSGCERRSGDLGSHVSTIEVSRDMDVLRAALGEEKMSYLGFSYGTKLGATYAELFPERVGRFVLDGGIDPRLGTFDSLLGQAEAFEIALRSYLRNCVEGGECFLGDGVGKARETIQELLADIDAEPLPTSDEREVTIGRAFSGLSWPLYAPYRWPDLDRALAEALDGTGDTFLRLADFYDGRRQDGSYADNGGEAISVINCLDNPWSIPAKRVSEYDDEFIEASPTFGRFYAWSLVGCHGSPFQTTEPEIEIDAEGADPIVVIGTTRDPATPYDEAVALAQQLESGVLLSRDGDGHTAYASANACIDALVHAYFLDGTVPPNGGEC